MKITLEVSEKCEATESPYWLILDPGYTWTGRADMVAEMVTGPFFSRESAEAHLETRRYAFGRNAIVYCHSGCWSQEYKQACRDARAAERQRGDTK